jgi:hypothetical protein
VAWRIDGRGAVAHRNVDSRRETLNLANVRLDAGTARWSVTRERKNGSRKAARTLQRAW